MYRFTRVLKWPTRAKTGPLYTQTRQINYYYIFHTVHTSSRQHNILYLGLDIGPLILHTNSRQGKNAPQILDSNSRQKKILVIESTVTKVRFNDESSMF
jgi:hypothetical protein